MHYLFSQYILEVWDNILKKLVLFLNSSNFNFDIIVLSETWLGYDFKFVINCYHTISSVGKLNKSDEVTIFVKETIKLISTH